MAEQQPSATGTPNAGQGQSAPVTTGTATAEAQAAAAPVGTGTTGTPPPQGQQPAGQAAADQGKPVVPEKYDLKIPDGSTLDAKYVDSIAQFSKERKLTNEQAQAILERDNTLMKSWSEKQAAEAAENARGGKAWTERVNKWEADALADKEIGGSKENLAKSSELCKRVLDKHFDPGIINFLNETGLGSHPLLLKGFAKLGRLMADDKLVGGGQKTQEKKSHAEILYSKHNNQQTT